MRTYKTYKHMETSDGEIPDHVLPFFLMFFIQHRAFHELVWDLRAKDVEDRCVLEVSSKRLRHVWLLVLDDRHLAPTFDDLGGVAGTAGQVLHP